MWRVGGGGGGEMGPGSLHCSCRMGWWRLAALDDGGERHRHRGQVKGRLSDGRRCQRPASVQHGGHRRASGGNNDEGRPSL